MSDEKTPKQPETPYNGIIVSRDICTSTRTGLAYLGPQTRISLLIVSEDEIGHENPTFAEHIFQVMADPYPDAKVHLREGHRVRVAHAVVRPHGILAEHITFDMKQFLPRGRDELPQPLKEHNDE